MIDEGDIIPFSSSGPVGERVIVLAPHPDDESIGCGGAIRLLVKAGKAVKVVFLTKGEKADPATRDTEKYAAMREREAVRAAGVLGVEEYEFLRFSDRELGRNLEQAAEIVSVVADAFNADTVYSPSPVELNPDHRAAADIALGMLKGRRLRIAFYELTTPLRPNVLVDISQVYGRKRKAIRAYRSQIKITDYVKMITALNVFRTFTLGDSAKYAEAFCVVDGDVDPERVWWSAYLAGSLKRRLP